jgi:hypothetical protein
MRYARTLTPVQWTAVTVVADLDHSRWPQFATPNARPEAD